MDKLTKAFDNRELVLGVFRNFSKAFDTVNHAILLQKLNHYGIRGCSLKWLESYISNRTQYVSYNDATLKLATIKCGVPQGSILGPLLFLIYINDLFQVCKSTSPFLFSDDSNLFLSGNDPQVIQDTMNVELKNISEWLKANKLSINIKKTHYMLFPNINRSQPSIQIEIDNQKIMYTTKTKLLGVVIDHKLNWKDHISYISDKIARGLGIIIKARKCFTKTAMLSLYH